MTIKTMVFTHQPHVSFARFSFCWWRHDRLPVTSQWPEYYDTISCIMISNSLDIDFINGDIHSWSCNNKRKYKSHRCHRQNFPNWMLRLLCKITSLAHNFHINCKIIRLYFKIIIAFLGRKWHKLLLNDAKRAVLSFVIGCRCGIRNITPIFHFPWALMHFTLTHQAITQKDDKTDRILTVIVRLVYVINIPNLE